jgi:DNA polymerase I-like protein with 3'-5' exonuclease and polymerase domains
MADGLKLSLLRLYTELPPDVRLICCIHDEAILDAPLTCAEEVRAWAHRVMVEEMAMLLPDVPVEVESRVCSNWGRKNESDRRSTACVNRLPTALQG